MKTKVHRLLICGVLAVVGIGGGRVAAYQATWTKASITTESYSACYDNGWGSAGYLNFTRYVIHYGEGDDSWCQVNKTTQRDTNLRQGDTYFQESCCPTAPNGSGYLLGTYAGNYPNTHYIYSNFSSTTVRFYYVAGCTGGYRSLSPGSYLYYNNWANSSPFTGGLMSFAGAGNPC